MVVKTVMANYRSELCCLFAILIIACNSPTEKNENGRSTIKNDLINDEIYSPDHKDFDGYFPKSIASVKPLAMIKNVGNFCDSFVNFTIKNPGKYNIYATGELNNSIINGNGVKYIRYDRTELYFDLNNKKSNRFDSKENKQVILSYGSPNIDGLNIGGQFFTRQINPSNDEYDFIVQIPWQTLGITVPKIDAKIGFNLRVIDNDYPDERLDIDYKYRPLIKNLFNQDEDVFKPSEYGTIVLGKRDSVAQKKNFLTIQKIDVTPKNIFDLDDQCWSKVASYNIDQIVNGRMRGKKDLNAIAKFCWDSNNLYILIQIKDNFKIFHNGLMDYGRIEDINGNVIWEMNDITSKHAGGALKNQKVATQVYLKAGNYKLRYITDESHAFDNWNDKAPNTPFYGIMICN
ncbi:MAG: sugar-binding protein [Mucilaginibacter sp.]|uniref:sugar-binding protein n=1 Tax=Mucilaginibacter sp. TaxID=1882438 RepID=UPI0032671345